MNGSIIEFRELLWQTKDEKLGFRRINLERGSWKTGSSWIAIDPSVFKVSDVIGPKRNPTPRMKREFEYHQHRGDGLLLN